MLLAINIGNSNTTLGIFENKELTRQIYGGHFRILTNYFLTSFECGQFFQRRFKEKEKIEGIIICSVVPTLTKIYKETTMKYFRMKPIIVSAKIPLPIKILYNAPEKLGADRIADAVAAYCIYKSPAIVVDLGTATNFEVISEKGEYLGGAIAPGIDTSAKSLFQKAAQLSKINLKMPERAIGKTTEECLRSGIILGAIGQIEKIVDEIKSEFSRTHKVSKEKIEVIGTGGLVDFVSKQTKCFDFVDKELALKGLFIIYNFIKNEEICNKMS